MEANSFFRFRILALMVLIKFRIPMENSTMVRKAESLDREFFASASDSANSILDVLDMAGICSVGDRSLVIFCRMTVYFIAAASYQPPCLSALPHHFLGDKRTAALIYKPSFANGRDYRLPD